MNHIHPVLTVLSALAMNTAAQAATVVLNNPSFEDPLISGDGAFVVAGSIAGWGFNKTTGGSFQDFGVENSSAGEYTNAGGAGTPLGADGTNVAFLNQGINNGSAIVNIFQSVGAILPNTTYTLTVAIGQRLDRVNGAATIALIGTASGSGITGNPFTAGTLLSQTTGVSSVSGAFQDFTTTFTTGAGVTGDLTVGARYLGDGTIQASLDNFRLTAVPEPSAVALVIAGGLLGLGSRRRSR